MKKRTLWLSVLLAVVLLLLPLAACTPKDNGDGDDDDGSGDGNGGGGGNGGNGTEITWSVAQIGGEANKSTTTALKLTFSADVASLLVSDLTIGSAATLTAGQNPEKDAASSKIWTVPVSVTASGNATVKITKAGISAAQKNIAVIYGVKKDFANSLGKDPAYTGTVFTATPPTYPATMPEPYPNQPNGQKIPGRVMCAFYDDGGLGVAFQDSGNNAGGGIRQGNPMVDVKFVNNGDDGAGPHMVPPVMGTSYVGWTNTGEWFNMTVDIQEDGLYDVALCYSSNNVGAQISLMFDPEDKEVITPTCTTGHHKWNKEKITSLSLKAGISVLRVTIEAQGQMNLSYLEFTKVTAVPAV